jgi:hypothetical protein
MFWGLESVISVVVNSNAEVWSRILVRTLNPRTEPAVLVLSLLSRFSPRFGTSRVYVNSVRTDARFLKPKIGENLVPFKTVMGFGSLLFGK